MVGAETRVLLMRSSAISLKNEGPDAMNTATGYISLGVFYFKNVSSEMKQGKDFCKKGLEILTQVYGQDHSYTVKARNKLGALFGVNLL
jgi:hypothetical protein